MLNKISKLLVLLAVIQVSSASSMNVINKSSNVLINNNQSQNITYNINLPQRNNTQNNNTDYILKKLNNLVKNKSIYKREQNKVKEIIRNTERAFILLAPGSEQQLQRKIDILFDGYQKKSIVKFLQSVSNKKGSKANKSIEEMISSPEKIRLSKKKIQEIKDKKLFEKNKLEVLIGHINEEISSCIKDIMRIKSDLTTELTTNKEELKKETNKASINEIKKLAKKENKYYEKLNKFIEENGDQFDDTQEEKVDFKHISLLREDDDDDESETSLEGKEEEKEFEKIIETNHENYDEQEEDENEEDEQEEDEQEEDEFGDENQANQYRGYDSDAIDSLELENDKKKSAYFDTKEKLENFISERFTEKIDSKIFDVERIEAKISKLESQILNIDKALNSIKGF